MKKLFLVALASLALGAELLACGCSANRVAKPTTTKTVK
jgi:hypothetical protein